MILNDVGGGKKKSGKSLRICTIDLCFCANAVPQSIGYKFFMVQIMDNVSLYLPCDE